MVDHFTKWPEIFPLKDATAPTIAHTIFDQWCCRYGIMDRLHSDGASNVHGDVMNELCRLIGTVKSKSSRLHPQGDGMAESTVKIMKSCIRKQVDQYGQDWDLYLHSTAFAIRTSINGSTKFTPAELILGDNLRRPIDVSSNDNVRNFSQRQAKEFASSLVEKIEKTAVLVNQNVAAARAKMKLKYDKKNSSHEIKVGDSVMLWWPYYEKNIPRSFQPKWKGPWVVIKLIDYTNCTIQDDSGKTKNVHLNQLKPIVIRNAHNTYPPILYEENRSCVSFDDFHDDVENVDLENVNDGNINYDINNAEQHEPVVNYSWCNIDESNIIPHRTRNSGGVHGDTGSIAALFIN